MKSQPSAVPVNQRNRTSLAGVVIIGAVLALFLVFAWNRCSQRALTDYEGVIVDRSAGYRESEQGSQPYFHLIIERGANDRITVKVDPETFQRSQVGMKIVSHKGKIELQAAAPEPTR